VILLPVYWGDSRKQVGPTSDVTIPDHHYTCEVQPTRKEEVKVHFTEETASRAFPSKVRGHHGKARTTVIMHNSKKEGWRAPA
jgi:hypothetical protein